MRFQNPTKLELFLDGFQNCLIALECYDEMNDCKWSRKDFWEVLSMGWMDMQCEYLMSQPGFDPYNLEGRDSYYSYVMRIGK